MFKAIYIADSIHICRVVSNVLSSSERPHLLEVWSSTNSYSRSNGTHTLHINYDLPDSVQSSTVIYFVDDTKTLLRTLNFSNSTLTDLSIWSKNFVLSVNELKRKSQSTFTTCWKCQSNINTISKIKLYCRKHWKWTRPWHADDAWFMVKVDLCSNHSGKQSTWFGTSYLRRTSGRIPCVGSDIYLPFNCTSTPFRLAMQSKVTEVLCRRETVETWLKSILKLCLLCTYQLGHQEPAQVRSSTTTLMWTNQTTLARFKRQP